MVNGVFISERNRSGTITISEIYITSPNYVNGSSEVEDSTHSGVFPATVAPPPYTGNWIEFKNRKINARKSKRFGNFL